MARPVAPPPSLSLPRLAVCSLALTLAAACPPGRAAAQDPAPTAIPSWRVYLPISHRPVKELILAPEVAQLGGRATGIAVAGGMIFQAQGATLLSWLPTGDERGWAYQGGLQLLDEAPSSEAWLTADGGVLSFIRQLPGPAPVGEGEPAPFLRLSLGPIHADGVTGVGASLELPGRLISQARAGDRLFVVTGDAARQDVRLLTVDVSRWERPRVLDAQPLTDQARFMVALPDLGLLVAIGSASGGRELWSWDIRSSLPRARPTSPLAVDDGTVTALLRSPEGLLVITSGGLGRVIPVRPDRPPTDLGREIAFDLRSVEGPDDRAFGEVDAAIWAAGMACLYRAQAVSYRTSARRTDNLLACFDLPAGGQPVVRRVMAADPVIDASAWLPTHLAVASDTVLLSRASAGGVEVLGPLTDPTVSARTLDAPPGHVRAVIRQRGRLVTSEGDTQVRSWAFDPDAFGGLRHLGRVSSPLAGYLITVDLPGGQGAAALDFDLVLWRQRNIGVTGRIQRIRSRRDGALTLDLPQAQEDVGLDLRAAGPLVWSPVEHDGRILLAGSTGFDTFPLPFVRSPVQDVAHAGGLLVMAVGADGLLVLDDAFRLVGALALPGPAGAVAVDPSFPTAAWVATGPLETTSPPSTLVPALHCVDLGDPRAPRLMASVELPLGTVERLRAAGADRSAARVVGSVWQSGEMAGVREYRPLLFDVDARDCSRPSLVGATRWREPPPFLRSGWNGVGTSWDLSPDGARIYAARDGLAVYRLVVDR